MCPGQTISRLFCSVFPPVWTDRALTGEDGFVPCEGGAEGSISWTGEKGRASGACIGDDESVVSEGGDFRTVGLTNRPMPV
jgi:hypothetical protein